MSGYPGGSDKRLSTSAAGTVLTKDQDHAILTYRYLRLAIISVVLALLVSVLLERAHATCWQESISSYYYTPVHSIFIVALGVIGVALISIRGGTTPIEVLLNQAGFLAPVVALVPTGWSSSNCPSNLSNASKATIAHLLNGNTFFAKFSSNNLLAYIIGAFSAVVLAKVAAWTAKKSHRIPPKELEVPALGISGIIVGGYIWREVRPASFNAHAHGYAALLMFALVGVAILLTGLQGLRTGKTRYVILYFTCAGVMAGGFLVIFIVGRLMTWHHQVLLLEGIEATAFVVFWFFQTIELWDIGLPESTAKPDPLGA